MVQRRPLFDILAIFPAFTVHNKQEENRVPMNASAGGPNELPFTTIQEFYVMTGV